MLTLRPSHWSVVHVLLMSWSVLLVCVMTYSDVPSGVVVQAGETVSALVVLEDTVRVWPAPVPAVIVTGRPVHRLAGHALAPAFVVVGCWGLVSVWVAARWGVAYGVGVDVGGRGSVMVEVEE